MSFLLYIPFLLIRFGLLAVLNKEAVGRAAHFAPVQNGERAALYIYQLTNLAIFIYPFFLKPKVDFSAVFYIGAVLYVLGMVLLTVTIVGYAFPSPSGINQSGIYRLSRNPMYVAYFFVFTGCALITRSWILLVIVLVFQICTHFIILAEERWCLEKFGDDYRQYMQRVRRYL